MTSSVATNSRKATDALLGAPKFLQASYSSPSEPLEKQIPLTSTTLTNTTGNYADVFPDTNVVILHDDVTGGNINYQFTAAYAQNFIGRQSFVAFSGTPAAGNTIAIVLPATWEYVANGIAAGTTSMSLPANARATFILIWNADYTVSVMGDITGYTFA